MSDTVQLHHATAAKAKRLGFTFYRDEEGIVAVYKGTNIVTAVTPTEAMAKAIQMLDAGDPSIANIAMVQWRKDNPKAAPKPRRARDEDDEDGDEDDEQDGDEDDDEDDDEEIAELEAEAEEEDEESAEGKSVVKKKYKTRYRPFKHRNGDDIGKMVTEHVAERDEKGEIVQPVRTDPDRLEDFAKANGVWSDDYNHLNVGMRRMNIGNRIRSKVKKGEEIVWN